MRASMLEPIMTMKRMGTVLAHSRAPAGEIQGRCRADAGQIQGRYRADTGQIQGRYAVLGHSRVACEPRHRCRIVAVAARARCALCGALV